MKFLSHDHRHIFDDIFVTRSLSCIWWNFSHDDHRQVSGDSLSRSSPPPLPSAPQMASLPLSRFFISFIVIIIVIAIVIVIIIVTVIILIKKSWTLFLLWCSCTEDIWRWGPFEIKCAYANPTEIMRMIWHLRRRLQQFSQIKLELYQQNFSQFSLISKVFFFVAYLFNAHQNHENRQNHHQQTNNWLFTSTRDTLAYNMQSVSFSKQVEQSPQ